LHRDDEYPGTGMGLAIVRTAAQRMGGVVCLDSESGQGSQFRVKLPAATQR
jgi:signal transduction histidine kinase